MGDRLKILWGAALVIAAAFVSPALGQNEDLEVVVDGNQRAAAMPAVFSAGIDVSGRGLHSDVTWPQTVAAREALDAWKAGVGFAGMYRIQYNLWEVSQLNKAPDLQKRLLANYEEIIGAISDAGGTVIVNFYGTPAGLGPVPDKKGAADDIRAFKRMIKDIIRELSCNKKYNVWYAFWSAPDLEEFYLGRKQDYFNLYRAVAESVKELRRETKLTIPLGGPSVSWWFQNAAGNTNATPEKSLVYELIKFCYQYRLPLDFISWHAYSTDPAVEKEATIYGKSSVTLVREWLSYFGFDRHMPVIVDEWNYDRDANVLPERKEKSFIAASYIVSRIKAMHQAGVDRQIYYCLEDFQNNREGVVRNVGVFYFDSDSRQYKGGAKATFNVFQMLSRLGKDLIPVKFEDDFLGAVASRSGDNIAILLYNYIDPDIAASFFSRNLATLPPAERKILVKMVRSREVDKLMVSKKEIDNVRAPKKIKALLRKAQELNERAKKFEFSARELILHLKNMKGTYRFQRYVVDSSCSAMCEFAPVETREIVVPDAGFLDKLTVNPYSVHLLVLEKQPDQPAAPPEPGVPEQPVVEQPVPVAPSAADQPEEKTETAPLAPVENAEPEKN